MPTAAARKAGKKHRGRAGSRKSTRNSTLLFGMFVYHWLEGWSYLDSLYFCVISTATIGYGDFVPTTPTARAFTIVYVLNGIVILLALFDRIRAVRGRELERATAHPSNPTSDPTT